MGRVVFDEIVGEVEGRSPPAARERAAGPEPGDPDRKRREVLRTLERHRRRRDRLVAD